MFWLFETIWAFIVLGLFEAYFKEWAIKFARWYTKPLLTLSDKAELLPRIDEMLLHTSKSFQEAAQDALFEAGKTYVGQQLAQALQEIAETFDIEIYRAKQLEEVN